MLSLLSPFVLRLLKVGMPSNDQAHRTAELKPQLFPSQKTYKNRIN